MPFSYYDDKQRPKDKDVLRETFNAAKLPAEIEVYPAAHGWCPPDSQVYSEPQAERARFGEAMEAAHPSERHWYLNVLSTAPGRVPRPKNLFMRPLYRQASAEIQCQRRRDRLSAAAMSEDSDPVKSALAAVPGLADRLEHKPNQLSGGQQQRVAIARSLVNNPVMILADEPTGALDTHTSEEIMHLFQDLNAQGTTIILVTHEPEVAAYAKRQLVFRDGLLVSDDLTTDLQSLDIDHRPVRTAPNNQV